MLAAGFIAWATLAISFQRRWTALVLVLAGLLVHETAYVFGAPLLVIAFWDDYRSGVLDFRQMGRLIAALVAGAAAILVAQGALSASPDALAASMVAAFPVADADRLIRDLAIYMAAGGSRALGSAVCHNFELNPKWFITGVASLLVLAAYAVILPLWRRPLALLLAVFAPMLFMLLVANDVGRWLKLAVVNAWLLTAILALRHGEFRARTPPSLLAGVAALGVLIGMGYTPFDDVNAYSRDLIAKRGYRYDMTIEGWLDRCDASWREVVYGKR
ncbi:hypothetical protein EON77_13850 [bacterium]|nr:MAG: hypothetical protein EON77_13850 [bacterium]